MEDGRTPRQFCSVDRSSSSSGTAAVAASGLATAPAAAAAVSVRRCPEIEYPRNFPDDRLHGPAVLKSGRPARKGRPTDSVLGLVASWVVRCGRQRERINSIYSGGWWADRGAGSHVRRR